LFPVYLLIYVNKNFMIIMPSKMFHNGQQTMTRTCAVFALRQETI
jgi:hypothetical protein